MSHAKERFAHVLERVASAAIRSGRQPSAVTVIGVSKYVDASKARELVESGCKDLGESRPQSLWEKASVLSDLKVRWHMIGHLQRNKVARTLPLIHCIHSLDSVRLAEQIDADANRLAIRVPVLLEVNVSKDSTKTGLSPSEACEVCEKICQLPNLQLEGVMGMSSLEGQDARSEFSQIRDLRDKLQREVGNLAKLDQLSMGMSNDFEDAILEGSTMIRIGSLLLPN